MQEVTTYRLEKKMPVLKYFGHWAYIRILSVQEPASAFFSFCNAIPHFLQLMQMDLYSSYNKSKQKNMGGNYYFMEIWLKPYPFIAILAWLASTLYHIRKTAESTLFDFCAALLFLSYGLLLTVRRLLGPACPAPLLFFLVTVAGGLFTLRLQAMVLGHIRFDVHMELCIAIAVITVSLWMIWLLSTGMGWIGYPSTPKNRMMCLGLQVAFSVASSLEIFDFPPIWGHFDAHALWHAATVPLGFLWYSFWFHDSLFFREKRI